MAPPDKAVSDAFSRQFRHADGKPLSMESFAENCCWSISAALVPALRGRVSLLDFFTVATTFQIRAWRADQPSGAHYVVTRPLNFPVAWRAWVELIEQVARQVPPAACRLPWCSFPPASCFIARSAR
jgi:hypothetical protein